MRAVSDGLESLVFVYGMEQLLGAADMGLSVSYGGNARVKVVIGHPSAPQRQVPWLIACEGYLRAQWVHVRGNALSQE